MSKIQFPVELGYGYMRIDCAISNNPNVTEGLQNAKALSKLVGELKKDKKDAFKKAGLSYHLPERYRTPEDVFNRADAFSQSAKSRRPTAAYLIKDVLKGSENEPENNIIGMLSFGRDDHNYRLRGSGERVLSSWFHGDLAVRTSPENIINSGIKIAHDAGLRTLKLIKIEEQSGRNFDLVVAEHHIKPAELGFKQIDEGITIIEGEEFEGTVWRRDVS